MVEIRVCIVAPEKDVYSETFIRAHRERLVKGALFLYGENGGSFPIFMDNDRRLASHGRFSKFIARISKRTSEEHAFERYLLKNSVDVVLAEYGPTGQAVADCCRRAKMPLVVHFHGYDAHENGAIRRMDGYRKLFENVAAIVAVSRVMERQLLALGAPRNKLYYNPYGVVLSCFEGARPETAPPVFLAVGRFADKKAPLLTILAFRKVLERVPEIFLRMVGDGPLLEASKELAATLGISKAVEFCGRQDHETVSRFMKNARGFVQHSVTTSSGDSEGTPVAVLEASASGLPVVATRHAGIADVVEDGKTGFLVEERDVDGMAERLVLLATDPALAGRLGAEGRKRIHEHFSEEKSLSELRRILNEAARPRI